MRWRRLRVRNLLSVFGLCLILVYIVIAVWVTVVSIGHSGLEPSVLKDTHVVVRHDIVPRSGQLAAFRTDGQVEILRIFLSGPARIQCFRQTAILNGVAVSFRSSKIENDAGDEIHEGTELWGEQHIAVRRKTSLLPWPVDPNLPIVEVSENEFLVGCQNRLECAQCGLRAISKASVLGWAFPLNSGTFW